MNLKEQFKRFKKWQHQSSEFIITSDEEHECPCCGYRFKGNFCPCCSQKADLGPIGWSSVRQSFMDIWGLGSRSLPRTVWHLFLRPGHLISDYISGKRQVSFPPVKMLFFVSVIVALLVYWLMPLLFGSAFDVYGGNISKGFNDWNKTHFAWTYFGMALLGILPTWVMFRNAPRNARHTLPQGFFIQIFMCVLNVVLSFVILLPVLLMSYSVYLYVSWALLILYYVTVYKHLFGYRIWGTLWRVLIVWGFIIYTLEFLFIIFGADANQLYPNDPCPENNRYIVATIYLAYGLIVLALGWAINLIASKLANINKE